MRRYLILAALTAAIIMMQPGVASAAPREKQDHPGQGRSKERGTSSDHGKAKQQEASSEASPPSSEKEAPAAKHKTEEPSATQGSPSEPQPASNADFSGHGANVHGPYDSTRDGSPSENGNGGGNAAGKPCAGCVGKADNKNPPGQMPGGSDRNKGYECDSNHGVGKGNPAHTGCAPSQTPPPVPTCPDGTPMPVKGNCPTAPEPMPTPVDVCPEPGMQVSLAQCPQEQVAAVQLISRNTPLLIAAGQEPFADAVNTLPSIKPAVLATSAIPPTPSVPALAQTGFTDISMMVLAALVFVLMGIMLLRVSSNSTQ